MSLSLTYNLVITLALVAALVTAGGLAAWHAPDWPARIRRPMIAVFAATTLISPAINVEKREAVTNLEVYFAVDLTGSMAAQDYQGNSARLVGVRADMKQLTNAFPGARFSVFSYSSVTSRQLPLTTDLRAVNSWAETAKQELTSYSTGSIIDRPVDELQKTLKAAKERNPSNVRVLFLFTDGESTKGEAAKNDTPDPAEFGKLSGLIDGGAVLGYGSEKGGKMLRYLGRASKVTGASQDFIKDPATGQDAISKIDEPALKEAAAAMGVRYLHRVAPDSLANLVSGVSADQIASDGRREVDVKQKVFWPFMLGMAVLIGIELFGLARGLREMREDD